MKFKAKDPLVYCFYLIAVLIVLIGCKSTIKSDKQESTISNVPVRETEKFAPGYIKHIKCLNDAQQSYELFLPSAFNTQKALPVIFIFDAHGRGHIPIELYKDLAESFGYILVASNNSKNGQELTLSNEIYHHLLNDLGQRFSIDSRRIYTMGFSGGSRVAGSLAITEGGIAGVIGCSAGISNGGLPGANTFNFIGFAGNEDFNLSEMQKLDNDLNQSPIRHQLIVFDGKHEWCKADEMKQAFYWITFNAIRSQLIPTSDSLFVLFLKEVVEHSKSLIKAGREYEAYLNYAKVVNFLDGLYNVEEYKEKFSQLQNSDKIRSYESYLNRIVSEESRIQKQYNTSIAEKEPAWWSAEVENLYKSIKKDKIPAETQFKKRLLSYCSLLAYTYSNKAILSNQLDVAAKYIRIYAIVDPTNPEHAFMNAILMMKYNSTENALTSLKEAIKLGFEDKERILNQPEFESLKSNEAFNGLLGSLK